MISKSEASQQPERILVEDDQEAMREVISLMLREAGYECSTVATPIETLDILECGEVIDLVCCGFIEWSSNDLSVMFARAASRSVPVIVTTSITDLSVMKTISQMGAYDFLQRPFPSDLLTCAVRRALQYRRLRLENLFLRDRLGVGSGIELPWDLLVRRSMGR